MAEVAVASGAAHDPTIIVENNVAALEAALAAAREAADAGIPARDLANAEAKLEKLREHVAAAEAEVSRLRALVEGN